MARAVETDDIDDTTTKATHVMRVEPSGDGDLPFSFDDFDFDLEEFLLDDASVEGRNGVKTYPYVGMSVWLAPFQAPMSLVEGGAAARGNAESAAKALPLIRDGISQCVAGHNIIDPRTGEYYPQFWRNPDALLGVPVETMYDLVSLIMNGELSETRKKESSNGRAGTTTRRSTARRTRR